MKSIKSIIYKYFVPNFVKQIRRKKHICVYPIIKEPQMMFEVVTCVKEASWEKACYAECYGHNKAQQLEVFSPEDVIYRIKDGIVSEKTDVVIVDNAVFWGKYNQEEFVTYSVPFDNNVLWFDRDNIALHQNNNIEYVPGKILPLIGLGAHHWVHCLYEFLPRLFSAGEAGLLEEPITILVIENVDNNIMEIINNYLQGFPAAKIKIAQNDVVYRCQELYFQHVAGPSDGGYKFRLDYPWYIPQYIIDQTNRYIVNPLVTKVKDNQPIYEKIFLGRSPQYAANNRTLLNYDEVHDFFMNQGYVDVEGSILTLEEKVSIFYHAKEIVALFGSSNMNFIFCNNAKCMVLGNYKFATDPIFYSYAKDKVSSYVYVTGQDEGSDFHSSYYIPLEKIKRVYNERMIEN